MGTVQAVKMFFRRPVVQDAAWYTISNILAQITNLISILFVSRYLGPTNLGLYSFIQNYLAVFVTILASFDIRANWTMVHSNSPRQALYTYLQVKTVLTLPTALLFALCSYILLPRDIFYLTLVLLLPFVSGIFSSCIFLLQYENKSRFVAISTILSTITTLILKLVAVYIHAPLIIFVCINSLDGGILIALCTYVLFRETKIKDSIQHADIYEVIRTSMYPLIYMFTWYVVIRVDQFFVPLFFDTRTLGLYASAVKIVETSNVLIVIMQAVVTPRILSLQQADTDTRRVNITTLAYVICGICAMIGTVICAPWIVSLLFGTRFSDATPILQVYALSIPGLFVTYLFTTIALSKGSYKPIAILSTGVAIVVLLMTYVAAYMGSIQMVAAVSVITYTSVGYILYILWRRNIV